MKQGGRGEVKGGANRLLDIAPTGRINVEISFRGLGCLRYLVDRMD